MADSLHRSHLSDAQVDECACDDGYCESPENASCTPV